MLTVNHDLHVHTYLSACCNDKINHRPDQIIETAQEMGLTTLGFADHVWQNPDIEPSRWYRPQDASQISRLREDLKKLDANIRILVGCEAETIAPGQFGISRDFAEQLDFVQLACSHLHMKEFVAQPKSDRPRHVAEHCLELFRSAAASGIATAIPHSFLPLGYLDNLPAIIDAISDAEFIDAYSLAAEHGVGIEITTGYLPDPSKPGRLECGLRIIALARQAGCQFTFGSDAHDLPRLRQLPELTRFIKELDLTEADIHPITRGSTE